MWKKMDIDDVLKDAKSPMMYFIGVLFGFFLILWWLYYYLIGHPVRMWVSFLWWGTALWIILFNIYNIFDYPKKFKNTLCTEYRINDSIFLKKLNEDVLQLSYNDLRVIFLKNEKLHMRLSIIFFIKNNQMHQVWVDERAGLDIAYHCLKWYLDRDEMPKCVIVRDLGTAYKVLKQLVPKRLDPIAELKPAKKIDEERFLKYIRENFWLDKKTIEMELKRLEKEMNEENLKY